MTTLNPDLPAALAPAIPVNTAPGPAIQVKRVLTAHMQPVEAARGHFQIVAPNGFKLEEMRDPTMLWLQGSRRLEPGSIVDIRHVDFLWMTSLLVIKVDAETQSIFTRVLSEHDWSDEGIQFANMDSAVIEYRAQTKWTVIMANTILKSGFDTEAEAKAWVAKKAGIGVEPPAGASRGRTAPAAQKANTTKAAGA